MGKRILVTSGKGGTGKSMFCANIGLTLSLQGHSVLITDMNFGMKTMDLYLGVQNQALFDISDVIMGNCSLDRGIIKINELDGLSLIPASSTKRIEDMEEDDISKVFESLAELFDYVLIDAPPGRGLGKSFCENNVDAAILLVTPDYASLRDAELVESELLKNGVFDTMYVLNKIVPILQDKGIELDYKTIDDSLRCRMAGMILYDDNIRGSTNIGTPIVAKEDTYIAHNFQKIALRIDKDIENR